MRKALFLCLVLLAIPALSSAGITTWPAGVTVVADSASAGFIPAGCCAFTGQPVWHDRLTPGAGGDSTTFTFASPITTFGGTWDLAGPGGPGTGINVYFDGVLAGLIDQNTAGAFVSFSSLTPFTVVLLTADGQLGVAETYEMASLSYTGVPEPATIMLVGLGALVLTRRVRKG